MVAALIGGNVADSLFLVHIRISHLGPEHDAEAGHGSGIKVIVFAGIHRAADAENDHLTSGALVVINGLHALQSGRHIGKSIVISAVVDGIQMPHAADVDGLGGIQIIALRQQIVEYAGVIGPAFVEIIGESSRRAGLISIFLLRSPGPSDRCLSLRLHSGDSFRL